MDLFINQKMKRLRFRFGGSVTALLCNTVTSTDYITHTIYFPKIDYMLPFWEELRVVPGELPCSHISLHPHHSSPAQELLPD